MPNFAANLNFLFTEVPFLDRFAAAAKAGFTAVEYLFPYEYPEQELAARLKQSGLTQALINMPAGDWAGGERGLTCLPDRSVEFRAGIDTAIRYAQTLDCSRVHLVAGLKPADADPRRLRRRLSGEPALRGGKAGAAWDHGADRADQPARCARFLPKGYDAGADGNRAGGP